MFVRPEQLVWIASEQLCGRTNDSVMELGGNDALNRFLETFPTHATVGDCPNNTVTNGNRVKGPAVIEAVDTTIMINPGQEIMVNEFLNLVMEL